MNKEGWVANIKKANTDIATMDLLASYLCEIDAARQLLRDKGYGVTGTPILEQVKEIPILDDET